MLKHSYHARLSVWHVVLLVIILAISLPVIAKPVASPTSCNSSENAGCLKKIQDDAAGYCKQDLTHFP